MNHLWEFDFHFWKKQFLIRLYLRYGQTSYYHTTKKEKITPLKEEKNDMLQLHTINLNDNMGYMTDLVAVVEKLSSKMIRKLRVQTYIMPTY